MLKFGALRQMIDRTARIQICEHTSGEYIDFRFIEDVSHEYDERNVFGIGLVRSEYRDDNASNLGRYAYAIEIRLLEQKTIPCAPVLEYEAKTILNRGRAEAKNEDINILVDYFIKKMPALSYEAAVKKAEKILKHTLT